MDFIFTETQSRRLKELNATDPELNYRFESVSAREKAYQKIEKQQVKKNRQQLKSFREIQLRPGLCRLENRLGEVLIQNGFVQVTTPIIMSKGLLAKMSIDSDHALNEQIYWLDRNKCLRPMLAPHLYYVLKDLLRLWEKPIRIFEIGPCFRKESQGAIHSSEFTMLNLVEMGLPLEAREARLKDLSALVCEASGVSDYCFESVHSEVYGATTDVVAGKNRVEVGSAAMGPHPLDRRWEITETWVGIGFGLERLLMVANNLNNLAKMGRSLSYIDGIRLNI
jgi:phenylalanyl-tRNA synthetase alpha chain